jgi:hypothetical protein
MSPADGLRRGALRAPDPEPPSAAIQKSVPGINNAPHWHSSRLNAEQVPNARAGVSLMDLCLWFTGAGLRCLSGVYPIPTQRDLRRSFAGKNVIK